MPAPRRATRELNDGCPRRWSFRQVGPPYPPEEVEGGLEVAEPRVRPMQAVVPTADAATVTILRVEGLRPFASTTWLSRVLAASGPGPVVLEVLSLAPQGDGEDEMRIADQVSGQDPPSLPPRRPAGSGRRPGSTGRGPWRSRGHVRSGGPWSSPREAGFLGRIAPTSRAVADAPRR